MARPKLTQRESESSGAPRSQCVVGQVARIAQQATAVERLMRAGPVEAAAWRILKRRGGGGVTKAPLSTSKVVPSKTE